MADLKQAITEQAIKICKNRIGSCVTLLILDMNEDAKADFEEEVADCLSEIADDKLDDHYPLEWWYVDSAFGEELEEKGEVCFKWGMDWLWGRTDSGSAIHTDTVIKDIAKEHLREIMLWGLMGDKSPKWEGLDIDIDTSLDDYGVIWLIDEVKFGSDQILLLMKAGEDQWTHTFIENNVEAIRSYYDWIDWEDVAKTYTKNVWDLHLIQVISELANHGYQNICGEAYEGFRTRDEVLFDIWSSSKTEAK